MYIRFIKFLPLLAQNAMTWSFSIITLFVNALPSKLQEDVQLGGYVLSDLSTLLTSHLQKRELQRLREQAAVDHKTLQDESKRINKLMTIFGTTRGSSINN